MQPLTQLQNLSTYGATVMLQQATQSSPVTLTKTVQTAEPRVSQTQTQTDVRPHSATPLSVSCVALCLTAKAGALFSLSLRIVDFDLH